MTDPTRLLEGDGDDFERMLLRSAAHDAGSSFALHRSVGAASAAAAIAVSSGVAGAASSVVAGGLAIAKWFGVGALAGTVAVSGAAVVSVSRAPDAPASRNAPPSSKAEPALPSAVERPVPSEPAAPEISAKPNVDNATASRPGVREVSRGSSLGAELAELGVARDALERRDFSAAQASLARHARDFPNPALGPEAAVLRARLVQASSETQVK